VLEIKISGFEGGDLGTEDLVGGSQGAEGGEAREEDVGADL
jgi:hypothetical protein